MAFALVHASDSASGRGSWCVRQSLIFAPLPTFLVPICPVRRRPCAVPPSLGSVTSSHVASTPPGKIHPLVAQIHPRARIESWPRFSLLATGSFTTARLLLSLTLYKADWLVGFDSASKGPRTALECVQ